MNQQLVIEHECPQCGAPVTLTDSDRILSCRYCRVRLYAFRPQYPAYYLPARHGAIDQVFYVPYWRLHGMEFVLSPGRIEQRLVDTSRLASSHDDFPPSLGVRTQTLKARFFEFHRVGSYVQPSVGYQEVRAGLDQSSSLFDSQPALQSSQRRSRPSSEGGSPAEDAVIPKEQRRECEGILRVYVGEVISMIWAPFQVRNGVLYDAMAGRALRNVVMPDDLLRTTTEATGTRWEFLAVLCPHCGWELEGEHQSLVLRCMNCASAWQAVERGFERVSFFVQGPPTQADLWLPFWQLAVDVGEIGLQTYADFVHLTGLPRMINPAMGSEPFRFWVPAFRANPRQFLRLAKVMTVNQTDLKQSQKLPRGAYYPVTLPLGEGFESVPVVLGTAGPLRRRLFELVRRGGFRLRSSSLVYVPFIRRASDYVQPQRKASILTSALKWARQL